MLPTACAHPLCAFSCAPPLPSRRHTEPTDPTCNAWGQLDWNTDLFPNPVAFVSSLTDPSGNNTVGHPLALSLNLHLQGGVDHCAVRYAEMGAALGFDTSRNATIPCDLSNATVASALFGVYLDATPLDGVSWWWTDYSGCSGPPNALAWSNYLFGAHRSAVRNERPMVLSRWGGLGTHRYPVGFSGDTFQHELILDFQIATTAMAANVMHAWSHDVGGFHPGTGAPGTSTPSNVTGSELYLRWIQFGALSPILRTHITKPGPTYGCEPCERRIWEFTAHFPEMRDAMIFRTALLPYLYTAAAAAAGLGAGGSNSSSSGGSVGVLPVHPLYYDFPAEEGAYSSTHQYAFGDAIIAAPISAMVDPATKTITRTMWVPPGAWARWDGAGGGSLQGPSNYSAAYGVGEIPLLVRAGTLLPLADVDPTGVRVAETSPDLVWVAWAGNGTGPAGAPAAGTALLREDDGVSPAAAGSPAAVTRASFSLDAVSGIALTVAAVEGAYPGMPAARGQGLQLRGLNGAAVGAVAVNGVPVPSGGSPGGGPIPGWYIAPAPGTLVEPEGCLVVRAGPRPAGEATVFTVALSTA